jgi:CO/xanthine dehydrogenase Mo-binding subunit
MNEHAPIEPQVSVAYIDDTDRLAIHTVSQDLYFHLGMLTAVFNLPMNKIRYIGGTVGGGFGAKNDIHCDHVAGLMALKIRKPVKYRLTRREETLYTTKRGAWTFEFTDGVKKDGRIIARKIRTLHDTGAYSGLGPYVVDKNAILVAGPFAIPNIWVDGTCVYTNKPPASSMRGFGIINGTSAEQLQMDRIAETIGMDPWEIRFVNAWRDGDLGATQFKVEAAGLIEAMKRAAELAGIELPAHLKAMSSRREGRS